MSIRFFDMFAGIGGFRSGLEAAGCFECVGHCEIDKYANKAYNAIYDIKETEVYFEDARKINPEDMPDIDLICGGFPCQSFSIAGKRGGFDDARGTLFFEIARIAAIKKPKYLLLENVPGLLSHDGGRTFATILGTLSELGYDVAWQVLNEPNNAHPYKGFKRKKSLDALSGSFIIPVVLPRSPSSPETIFLCLKLRAPSPKDFSMKFVEYARSCIVIQRGSVRRIARKRFGEGFIGEGIVWLVISVFPNPERECILSDILEKDAPEKYYLSQSQMERLLWKLSPERKETESIPQTERQSRSQVVRGESAEEQDCTT